MDQALKQRLVGTIVITALAAIFVPMLFDEPVDGNGRIVSDLAIPEPPDQVFAMSSRRPPANVDQVLSLPEPDDLHTTTDVENNAENLTQAKIDKGMTRWVIQVGSFGQQENALVLRDKLRKQGFSAFVEPFQSATKGRLFRLRVGPVLDQKRAQAMKIKLEKNNKIKSILVAE